MERCQHQQHPFNKQKNKKQNKKKKARTFDPVCSLSRVSVFSSDKMHSRVPHQWRVIQCPHRRLKTATRTKWWKRLTLLWTLKSDSEAISSSSSRVAEEADILACCCADVSACPSPSSSDGTSGVGLDGEKTKNAIKLNLHRQISMFHFFSCSNVFFTALWEQEVGLTWARAQSSPARPEGFPRSAARRLCLGLRRRHRVWASPRQVAPSCLRWRLRSPGSGGGQRAAGELLPLLQRRMTLYFNTGVCGALILFVEITKNHCIRF